MDIKLNTLIRQKKHIIHKTADGVVYLLRPADSTIHTLNKTASFIWELLAQPRTLKQVVMAVCENFSVQRQTATKDSKEFITNYTKLGFLELNPEK